MGAEFVAPPQSVRDHVLTVYVSERLLVGLLVGTVRIVSVNGVPFKDLRSVRMWYEHTLMSLAMLVCHESFDAVPWNEHPPTGMVAFSTVELADAKT